MEVVLEPSDRKDKKWKVVVNNQKTIHFGAKGMEDYTMHHEAYRQRNYITRHEKREDWENIFTAGFWSRWLLWNKPTLYDSIVDIENKFDVDIIFDEHYVDEYDDYYN